MPEPNETTAIALPDSIAVTAGLAEVREFHAHVHRELVDGLDYGTIPGTSKPTLLKPGAEKIAKLLRLVARYDLISATQEWDRGLFQFQVRCSLSTFATGDLIDQGVGECNSFESRYRYRWLMPWQLREHGVADTTGLRQRTLKSKYVQTRIVNPDPADQVNTILKVAKKRALVDAALSAGRLSELFTQDMEDAPRAQAAEPPAQPAARPTQHQAPAAPDNGVREYRPKVQPQTPLDNLGAFGNAVRSTAWGKGKTLGQMAAAVGKSTPAEIPDFPAAFDELEKLWGRPQAQSPPETPPDATSSPERDAEAEAVDVQTDQTGLYPAEQPITNAGEMMKVVNQRWGMDMTPAMVCKALGISTLTQVMDYDNALAHLEYLWRAGRE